MSQPLAYIHPNAKIGNGVTISPFVYIAEDVQIGDNTWIGPNVTIFDGARIGSGCKIFSGAVIAAIPQDLKFAGEKTTVEIGNNTIIREHVTIHRGTQDKITTKIGDNCLLMISAHIAHDCTVGNNVIIAGFCGLAGHVNIEDYVILEGYVAVQQFVTVGAHAFVAGTSKVRKNIPPFVKAAREPLSFVGVNTVGLRRRGFSNEAILQIEDIYRTIYVKGYNVTNALSIVEMEAPATPERNKIIQFIRASTNGIMRGIS